MIDTIFIFALILFLAWIQDRIYKRLTDRIKFLEDSIFRGDE